MRTKTNPWYSALRLQLLLLVGVGAASQAKAQANAQSIFQWEYMPVVQGMSLAYSPDGSTIAVGGVGGIQLINTVTRTQRSLTATPNADFNGVAISPDGKSLALGGDGAQVWSLVTGRQTGTINFPGVRANTIAYSPDGRYLAVAGFNLNFNYPKGPPTPYAIVQIYNASTLTPSAAPIYSKGGMSNSISFSKDSQHLIEGGSASSASTSPGYVDIWNVFTGGLEGSLNTRASTRVNSVALSPDGTQLAVAGSNTSGAVLEVWAWQPANLTMSIPASASSQLWSVAWSPDQKQLVVSGCQPTANNGSATTALVQTWDPATGKLVHNFKSGGSSFSRAVVFSPDGSTVANCQGSSSSSEASSPGGFVQIWNSSSASLETSIDTIGSYGSSAVAFSPNGTVVAQPWTSLTRNTLRLLNATNGQVIKSLPSQITSGLGPIAYSKTGGYLADAGILTSHVGSVHRSTGLVEIWSGTTSLNQFSLRSSANVSMSSIGFSDDGTKLAIGGTDAGGGVVELWSTTLRSLVSKLKTQATGSVNCVAVSTDGKFVANGGHGSDWNGVLEIWSASSGKAVTSLPTACTSTVKFLSFSPDGKTMAAAGYPASGGLVVEFWNTKDWSPGRTYTSNGAINGIAFTPDSKTLLFNWGYSLQALSVEHGCVFASYPDAGFGCVAVSPTSDRIVTTSANGQILAMTDLVTSVIWAIDVSINPGSFKGGSSATGTLKLSAPAPAGGLTLQLYVNVNGAAVLYPTSVVVPAGKTAATFTISSSQVTAATSGILLVESNGNFVTAQCTFTITP